MAGRRCGSAGEVERQDLRRRQPCARDCRGEQGRETEGCESTVDYQVPEPYDGQDRVGPLVAACLGKADELVQERLVKSYLARDLLDRTCSVLTRLRAPDDVTVARRRVARIGCLHVGVELGLEGKHGVQKSQEVVCQPLAKALVAGRADDRCSSEQ